MPKKPEVGAAAKPFLAKRLDPKPPAELVEKTLMLRVQSEIADFAFDLDMARAIWRKYRDVVEAPEMPDFLRVSFVKEYGYEPDQSYTPEIDIAACLRDNGIAPEVREQFLPEARETALRNLKIFLDTWKKMERQIDPDDGRTP